MIQYRYRDWTGTLCKSTKRGFNTKHEAEEWLSRFLQQQAHDLDMKFSDFTEIYMEDMKNRLREHTMSTKEHIIKTKILPYFGEKPVNKITVADVRCWQNTLIAKHYSQTYLKTINNQLSAIFNFAVHYYELSSNPCQKAGPMGKAKAEEKEIWTKDEFQLFADNIMDKRVAWLSFTILFWTGLRIGELLALTWSDIDLVKKVIRVNKSYQRLNKKDIVTAPKTPKSNRMIYIPQFLADDLQDYRNSLYDPQPEQKLLPISKSTLEKEMIRGCKLSGVKKIRIHDLRHSHASLLAVLKLTPNEAAERLGHENIETTLNIYSHVYPEKQEKLAEKLDNFYHKGTEKEEDQNE